MKEKKRILNLLHYLIVIFGCLIIVGCGGGGGGGGDDDDSGDTQAPSVPSGLSATAVSPCANNLSWNASTDTVGVTAYRIFRNGDFLKAVSATSASDTGLTAATEYCYSVSAVDAANNESAQTAQACATTSDPVPCISPEITTWAPKGDIENLDPLITATITSACCADIDKASIEMTIDDASVTPIITGSGPEVNVSYRPATELQNETTYSVTISFQDEDGRSGDKTWTFYTAFFY